MNKIKKEKEEQKQLREEKKITDRCPGRGNEERREKRKVKEVKRRKESDEEAKERR